MRTVSIILGLALATGIAHADPPFRVGQGDSRSWRNARLGFSSVGMTPELRLHYGAPEDRGTLITQVHLDSPASRLGLVVGDVVVTVNGEPVTDPAILEARLSLRGTRRALEVAVVRAKKSVLLRQEPLAEPRPFGAPRALAPQEREELIQSLQAEIRRLEERAEALRRRVRDLESPTAPPAKR